MNPDYTIGEISKAIGVKWSQMSEQDKAPYMKQNEEAKAQYAITKQELMDSGEWDRLTNASSGAGSSSSGAQALAFPLSRVKKMITLDPSIKRISKDGASVIAKAAEFFVSELASRCFHTQTKMAKRKTVSLHDIAQTIHHHEVYDWLRDDFSPR